MAAYPVPYQGGYPGNYQGGQSPIGPQAYNPNWPGWHPWGYGPGYPPPYFGGGGGCCPPQYPPPYFGGGGGCCPPGYPPQYPPNFPPQGGQPGGPTQDPEFNGLRNIAANVRNIGNGDENLDKEELEDLRNQALAQGDLATAKAAEKLLDNYEKLNDKGGGIFGWFQHDVGINQDTLFDILADVANGDSTEHAIDEEAQDH